MKYEDAPEEWKEEAYDPTHTPTELLAIIPPELAVNFLSLVKSEPHRSAVTEHEWLILCW